MRTRSCSPETKTGRWCTVSYFPHQHHSSYLLINPWLSLFLKDALSCKILFALDKWAVKVSEQARWSTETDGELQTFQEIQVKIKSTFKTGPFYAKDFCLIENLCFGKMLQFQCLKCVIFAWYCVLSDIQN